MNQDEKDHFFARANEIATALGIPSIPFNLSNINGSNSDSSDNDDNCNQDEPSHHHHQEEEEEEQKENDEKSNTDSTVLHQESGLISTHSPSTTQRQRQEESQDDFQFVLNDSFMNFRPVLSPQKINNEHLSISSSSRSSRNTSAQESAPVRNGSLSPPLSPIAGIRRYSNAIDRLLSDDGKDVQ